MSDSIPISVHLMRLNSVGEWYCAETAAAIAGKTPHTKIATHFEKFKCQNRPIHPWGERHVEAFSRGGMFAYAFENLIKESGFDDLGFLGDLTHTHEISVDYGVAEGVETVRLTVINNDYMHIANRIEQFISWCRENSEVVSKYFVWGHGNNLNGDDFNSLVEVIDFTNYSLDPNYDYGHTDSGDGALSSVAFSFLKTFIYVLNLAQRSNDLVICEQWGGFEPHL